MRHNYSHNRRNSLGARPGLLAALAAVAALLMLPASTVSPAAAASKPSESALLLAALPRYTCPAGTVKVTPSSAYRTAHGADVYHYAMKSGRGFDAYVPPAGFNPLTASNAVLAEMNFPTRPAKASSLAVWKQEMSGYKGTKQPEYCETRTPISQPASKLRRLSGAAVPEESAQGGPYYSGYLDPPPAGYQFTAVGADWYQPLGENTSSSAEVTWVGLGYGTQSLLQDGTSAPQLDGTAYAFFEYLDDPGVGMVEPNPVYAGEPIEAQVYYSSASGGTASFYVHANGSWVVDTQVPGLSGDYNGGYADWIVERLSNGKEYLPLTDTETIDFSDANGQTSEGAVPVSSSNVIGIVMTTTGDFVAPPCSTSSTMLEYPNELSGDTFQENWCRAS